jgi:hypothetical protein
MFLFLANIIFPALLFYSTTRRKILKEEATGTPPTKKIQ